MRNQYYSEKRFQSLQSKLSSPDANGCITLTSQLSKYPIVKLNNGSISLARFLFTYHYDCIGEIPSDFNIANTCKTSGCVNLSHLYLREPQPKRRRNNSAFRRKVLKRDNHQCQICPSTKYLEVHHLNSQDHFPQQFSDVDNGIVLCFFCHTAFHDNYGYGHNTKGQFIKFKSIYDYSNRKEIIPDYLHRPYKWKFDNQEALDKIYIMKACGFSSWEIANEMECTGGTIRDINKHYDKSILNIPKIPELSFKEILQYRLDLLISQSHIIDDCSTKTDDYIICRKTNGCLTWNLYKAYKYDRARENVQDFFFKAYYTVKLGCDCFKIPIKVISTCQNYKCININHLVLYVKPKPIIWRPIYTDQELDEMSSLYCLGISRDLIIEYYGKSLHKLSYFLPSKNLEDIYIWPTRIIPEEIIQLIRIKIHKKVFFKKNPLIISAEQRAFKSFKANIAPLDKNGCQIWLGHKHKNSYGTIQYKGRETPVHRWVFMYYYNCMCQIPRDYEIRHMCGVQLCVNIDHLSINHHTDKHDFHRDFKPKHSDVTIVKIYNLRKEGNSLVDIAKECNCSVSFASQVYQGHIRKQSGLDYTHTNHKRMRITKQTNQLIEGAKIKKVLDINKIIEIVKMFDNYVTQSKIAKKFKVKSHTISGIVTYKTYLHVPRICQRYINRIKNNKELLKQALNNPDLLIANGELVRELKKPLLTLAEWESQYHAKQIKKT